uniref:Uncharacterized protein n=1 Tax=Vespula pensylvanica TaxID=30213 RepID=A0A834P6X6_VESPE|nr:hypothetical protein H0235_004233 [Vespula pensylvanica]
MGNIQTLDEELDECFWLYAFSGMTPQNCIANVKHERPRNLKRSKRERTWEFEPPQLFINQECTVSIRSKTGESKSLPVHLPFAFPPYDYPDNPIYQHSRLFLKKEKKQKNDERKRERKGRGRERRGRRKIEKKRAR